MLFPGKVLFEIRNYLWMACVREPTMNDEAAFRVLVLSAVGLK